MQKPQLLLLLLLPVLLTPTLQSFTPTTQIPLPPQTTLFLYSPLNTYLLTSTPHKLQLLNGRTFTLIQQLDYTAIDGIVTVVVVSRDEMWMAVGMNNGEVYLYQYKGQGGKFVDAGIKYKSGIQSAVESVCFSADNSVVVIGELRNQITVWDIVSDVKVSTNFDGKYVKSVSCMPADSSIFVAAGGSGNTSKLTSYQYLNHTITPLKNFPDQESIFLQVQFSESSQYVYLLTKRGQFSKTLFSEFDFAPTIWAFGGYTMYGFHVMGNQKVLGVLMKGSRAVEIQAIYYDGKQYKSLGEFYVDDLGSFGMTVQGGHLVLSKNGKGQVYGLCQEGEYYNDATDTCMRCSQGCICDLNPTICYSCLQKYYLQSSTCLKCSTGCSKCLDAQTCTECSPHFILESNTCHCQQGYYPWSDICLKCQPGCLDCIDQNHCTKCKEEFLLKDGVCVCWDGKYLDGDSCLDCAKGCLECIDDKNCIKCSTGEHYVDKDNICVCDASHHFVDDGTKCICDKRYYQKDDDCLACPLGCLTCTSDTECQTCNEGLEIRDGVCKCINADEFLDQDGTCKRCSDTVKYCIECTDAQHCTACQAGINRELKNDKCECVDKFFPDEADVCQPCSIPGCLECESFSVCKTCDASNFWEHDSLTDKCKCIRNYTQYENSCIKCAVGCARCDPGECIDCDEYNHWIHDEAGQCKCNTSYYQSDQICQKCSKGCLTCDNPDTCLQCNEEFELIDGICTCPQGTYEDEDKCLPCARGCQACVDQANCIVCKDKEHYVIQEAVCVCDGTRHFVDDGTNCVCDQRFYQKDDDCLACPLGCLTCTSDVECQTCNEGLEIKDGVCKCINADEFLDQDGTCKRCSDTVKYCIECTDAQHCTACQAGINRELKNDKCECIDKFFPDEADVCQPCSIPGCLECESFSVCKTCDASNFWEHDSLTDKCKCIRNYTQYENSCIKCAVGCARCDPGECIDCDEYNHWVHDEAGQCKCNATYFQSDQICTQCMTGCLACQRADYCDSCDTSNHFTSKNGMCICQPSYFFQNSTCQSCQIIPHCVQCLNLNHCTQCSPTFILSPSPQKCICPPRKFEDKDKCSDCSAHCLSCTSATNCTTCQDGYKKDKKGDCVKDRHIKRMAWVIVGVMMLAALVFGLLR